MSLIAKPIVKNQYWIVTDGTEKVGNVIANASGFNLTLHGNNLHFKNTTEIKKYTTIEFSNQKTTKAEVPLSQYPTTNKVYNSILDIKRKLHLFTTEKKSKCYHVAGWFVLSHTGSPEVMFCPKYIFIQRYKYLGPYFTKSEAESVINTL